MLFKLINQRVIDHCTASIRESLGLQVKIEPPRRSKAQNDYYFNILTIIGKHTGDDKDTLHDNLKWSTLGPQYREYEGKLIATVKRSKDLSVNDFSQLIEAAHMMAGFLNVVIPPKPYFGLE